MATIAVTEREALPARVSDEPLYEVVRGQRLELPPMGARPTHIGSVLFRYLGPFCEAAGLGRVESEMLFLLNAEDRNQRRPDLAFVSFDRWPRRTPVPDDAAWAVVPDLAVEVVSPTDRDEEGLAKVREYFEAGVRVVWKVYPKERIIHIYDGFTAIRVLSGADAIDGGEAVPGFRLPLADLFEDQAEELPPA